MDWCGKVMDQLRTVVQLQCTIGTLNAALRLVEKDMRNVTNRKKLLQIQIHIPLNTVVPLLKGIF